MAALPGAALCLALMVPAARGATTLSEFVADAVTSSPEVREQVHEYRQVIQDAESALSGWRPSLDLSASYGAISRRAANTGQRRRDYDRAQASVTLSQNLFSGFDTTNQVKQAQARVTSAAYRLYDTADNVALDAVQAYTKVLTERQLVEYAAQNVEAHERILSKIRELSDQGITRRSDVEQTEGRLARAKASLIAQQNNLEDALTALHRLLGRYVDADELEEPANGDAGGEEIGALIDTALAVHPAIESARQNIEAARFDYERSKSSDLPRLDLRLQQDLGNDVEGPTGNLNERSVVLNLSYNLFRGGADRAEQRKRASAIQGNKAFLDRVRRQVIDTLRLAWSADRALNEQLPFLAEHVEKSLETLELYREEYLLQRRDLIDVLDAESELNGALSALAEARYAALTARFRVREGTGELFAALELDADLGDDQFRLLGLEPRAVDAVAVPLDRDEDGFPDDRDHCDNSSGPVEANGCGATVRVELGYRGVETLFEPVADRIAVVEGEATPITAQDLFANDRTSDPRGMRLRSFTQPDHGTLVADDEGNLVYRPAAGFTGTDGFSYEASDRRGHAGTASVTLVVGRLRPAPGLPERLVVRFDYKKLALRAESLAALEPVIEHLLANPEIRIRAIAHTDNVGSAGYNERLSRRRAEAMKQLLMDRGVAEHRITAVGMGELKPVADNATEPGRALNRRGEFLFHAPAPD